MDEEIRDWIQKKKKEAEELKKSEGIEEKTIPSSPEKLPAETQPAEEKTSEPIEAETQPVEQKTAVEIMQTVSPKIPETAVPSDNEPEEITEEEDQYPPPQASDTPKTEYPSKPPLLTKKSKILLVLIAIFVPVFLFIYFYFIPKILK